MSILTRYRASSPENPLTSFGDLFRFRSFKPLFDLRNRLKVMSGWGAQHRGRQQSPVPASDHEQLDQFLLETLGIDDLIAMDIPERELLLDPILPAKGLMMIHARRGGSKTFLALAIGLAVAGATSLLRWSAPKARRVLYVDGEMTLIDLQRRVAALKAGIGVDIRNDHFRLLAADHTDVPDLATEAGQRALDPLLVGVDLLIIDNISTLCWAGSDNSAGSWTSMQEWILRLRKRGLAVLLVHHSGKSGEQRGTSRREDVLDTVIGLRRPEDYEPQQGARVEVHVEKSRAHFGDAGRPFEARLVSTPDGSGLTWLACDLKPSHLEEAVALFRSGVTVRAAAAQLGIARSSAGRLRQKAQEDGLLESDDESEADGGEDESGTLH
jgi:putative DNA primase/helicase